MDKSTSKQEICFWMAVAFIVLKTEPIPIASESMAGRPSDEILIFKKNLNGITLLLVDI